MQFLRGDGTVLLFLGGSFFDGFLFRGSPGGGCHLRQHTKGSLPSKVYAKDEFILW